MEVRVRTTVALDKVGLLVEGRYDNPFELLGPHEVSDSGRRALAVRAFLPQSQQAWVVDPAAGVTTVYANDAGAWKVAGTAAFGAPGPSSVVSVGDASLRA